MSSFALAHKNEKYALFTAVFLSEKWRNFVAQDNLRGTRRVTMSTVESNFPLNV